MNDIVTSDAQTMLRQLVGKIETLEENKKEVQEDLKEVYAEAKVQGFDIKIIKKLIRIRKMDSQKLIEQEELLDLYKHAVGMV